MCGVRTGSGPLIETGDASPAGKDVLPVAAWDRWMFAGLDLRRRLGNGILVRYGVCFADCDVELTAGTIACVVVVNNLLPRFAYQSVVIWNFSEGNVVTKSSHAWDICPIQQSIQSSCIDKVRCHFIVCAL